jgi:hypothetical protein
VIVAMAMRRRVVHLWASVRRVRPARRRAWVRARGA